MCCKRLSNQIPTDNALGCSAIRSHWEPPLLSLSQLGADIDTRHGALLWHIALCCCLSVTFSCQFVYLTLSTVVSFSLPLFLFSLFAQLLKLCVCVCLFYAVQQCVYTICEMSLPPLKWIKLLQEFDLHMYVCMYYTESPVMPTLKWNGNCVPWLISGISRNTTNWPCLWLYLGLG